MFKFSKRSQENLEGCHSNLIELFEAALKTSPIDFSVICGHRDEGLQIIAFARKTSRLEYPNSKHNSNPSLAVDVQPYPYTQENINDIEHTKFRLLNEHIKKVADELGIPVLNGGLDWGWDWFHWELVL